MAFITLCVYAQQGYTFDCVGACVYMCVCSLVDQTYSSLTVLGSVGRGATRMTQEKRRSGDYGQVFVNTAKILAAPIRLQLSRELQ